MSFRRALEGRKIKQECEQRISKDVLSHCVLPLYEEKIKYKGQWHIQKKKAVSGISVSYIRKFG